MTPHTPKVSIIIPTYNPKRLAISLASVFSQTMKDWELILVDDASTDRTWESLPLLRDPRVRIIRNDQNRGGGFSRNRGIDEAKGEYLAFMDHDDEWFPKKLERQLQAIEQSSFRDHIVCYTQFAELGEGCSQFLPMRGKYPEEPVSEYCLRGEGYLLTSTLMISRDLCLKIRFPNRNPLDDISFSMAAEAEGAQFLFVAEVMAKWFRRGANNNFSKLADRDLLYQWLRDNDKKLSREAKVNVIVKWIWPSLIEQKGYPLALLRMASDFVRLGSQMKKIVGPKYFLRLIVPKDLLLRRAYRSYRNERLMGKGRK